MKSIRKIAAVILLSIGIGFVSSYFVPSYYMNGTSKTFKTDDKKRFDSWSGPKNFGFNIRSFTIGCGSALIIGGLYLILIKDE